MTPEQMELSRLRAENAWLKMHVEILKNDGVLCKGCAVKYVWIEALRAITLCLTCAKCWLASISDCRAWRRGGKPGPSLVLLLVVQVLGGDGGTWMHRLSRAFHLNSARFNLQSVFD